MAMGNPKRMGGNEMADYSDGRVIWRQRKRNWCRTSFSFTVYTLTDDELIVRSGIMRQVFDSVPLYRILDVTVERSLLQRVFGLSTVVINAIDASSNGVIRLVNVIDGMNVRRLLMRAIAAARSGAAIRPLEYLPGNGMDNVAALDTGWM